MTEPFALLFAWFDQISGSAVGASGRALEAGAGPDAILEALAGAVGLAVLGGLDEVPEDRRRALMKAGRRALLAGGAGGPDESADDAEDRRWAAELARAGLQALGGAAPDALGGPADPLHAPDGRLSAATLGNLDGFALASLALHVAHCTPCRRRAAVLRMASAPAAAPLRVAAASAVAMRQPETGRLIATFDAPAAELVLFDDDGTRMLAVYAEASAPVRLLGDGLETAEMLAGYWLGSLARDHTRVVGTLHVGDEVSEVDIDLEALAD
ncbi:MAG: hypothetical protein DRJ42_17985 [Deltaproteobacteria bacterium]|nr:MAG: hypothetical protein DRJ42_17985 [Deltaproteobacteria bacterium]